MDISVKLGVIREYFGRIDAERKRRGLPPHADTAHGIWGPSSMLDAYEIFIRLPLDGRRGFADLGSGDGRIALLAALFTESRGIEGDKELDTIARKAKRDLLPAIPELTRCTLVNADYTTEDLSGFDVLFAFADHEWNAAFEERIRRECKGVLLSYNRIFLPKLLKKGKTCWIQQLPVITYPLNTDEEFFAPRDAEP